ncbi:hypothetical protein HPB52_000274 [Rhipicephalus sanguineus]|uniref:Uncharacterized protein n=1 Tax=Rhipicephalus sanguineus TaxID=34632 RepID=A0A9D4PT53_RHISA|nr:hypothetical protein HPB52_000274 [Rhipicephalus sanguineus]
MRKESPQCSRIDAEPLDGEKAEETRRGGRYGEQDAMAENAEVARLHVTAMANSEQLRNKHGVLRAGVTRALTKLTDLLHQTDPDLSEVSVQVDYLKDRDSALSTLDDAILAYKCLAEANQGQFRQRKEIERRPWWHKSKPLVLIIAAALRESCRRQDQRQCG